MAVVVRSSTYISVTVGLFLLWFGAYILCIYGLLAFMDQGGLNMFVSLHDIPWDGWEGIFCLMFNLLALPSKHPRECLPILYYIQNYAHT